MAEDYQVIAFRDIAQLSRVDLYSSDPLTLDVQGNGFVGVATVLINDVDSPEFVVLSASRILAEVPFSERNARLRSVKVLLSMNGISRTAHLDLRSTVPGGRAVGFTKLLQAYLRVLFTNPGEDIANPWCGAGLYVGVGAAGTPGELRALASSAVSVAEQHLIRLQAKNSALTDAERLRSATLLQAEYVQASTSLAIRLTLTAMDGTTGNPLLRV